MKKKRKKTTCNLNFPVSWMVWGRDEGKYRAGGLKPSSVILHRRSPQRVPFPANSPPPPLAKLTFQKVLQQGEW